MGPKTHKPTHKPNLLQPKTSFTKRKTGKKEPKEDDEAYLAELGDDFMQERGLVKPEDQLELTDSELKEEFTRILTANNPNSPDNIIRFNFKEGAFKTVSVVEQMCIHFSIDGKLLAKDSDEARKQLAKAGSSLKLKT